MNDGSADQRWLALSYLSLRKILGILGIALPLLLWLLGMILFDTPTQRSISSYYHTGMGDVFVGTMCVIGVFLCAYRGYARVDSLVGWIGGIAAIGVALFPTEAQVAGAKIGNDAAHFFFAVTFFASIIVFCLFLFTKSDQSSPTPRKLKRNLVYRACGCLMIVCMLLILVYIRSEGAWKARVEPLLPVFWLESVAVWAFGVAWLVKGEGVLKDRS